MKLIFLLALILPLLAACAQLPAENEGESALSYAMAAQPGLDDPMYRIGPEDVLEVSVWREEGLHRDVLVRPDGWITFPLAGNVRAEGRTAIELENEITERLKRYIPDPVVTVTVKQIVGNKIYIIGKVNKPGEYVVGRYVDVMQALSLAGGLTPYASENRIKVLRREDDQRIVLNFEYGTVKAGRDLEQNILLQSGDVVVVP